MAATDALMRVFFLLLLLVSCASKTPPASIEIPVVVVPDTALERKPEAGRPKQKPPPAASVPPVSTTPAPNPCANLDTGNLKESITLKLDCLEKNSKTLPALPPLPANP